MSKRSYRVEIDGTSLEVAIESHTGVTTAVFSGESSTRSLRVLTGGPDPLVLVEGRVVPLSLGSGERRGLSLRGRHAEVRVSQARATGAPTATQAGDGAVRAPMPGRVVAVRAAPGDAVAAGAPLVVVEAMKMQNELLAPRAGTVLRVAVKEGDTVERGATLVELS